MFQYSYTVSAFTATLTSTSSVNSFNSSYTIEANTVTTYEELLLTTGTYQHTYTETSSSTYTIADVFQASTGTCDYSVTASSVGESGQTGGAFSTTSTYGTTHHATNGTHSVTTRSVVAQQVADLQSSTTQACTYTYYDVAVTSGSTDYGTASSYTFQTTIHDIFGTHTVSYRTLELVLVADASGSATGHCDYLAASTQSTSVLSNYTSYTIIYYSTTTHDIYNMGIHTVDGRTSEISSSVATVTLSSSKISETTATTSVNVYGALRTTRLYQTNSTGYYILSQLSVSYLAPENSETAYRDVAYTESTNSTVSDQANSYDWGSYYLTGSNGSISVGYSKGIFGNTYTMVYTSYYSQASSQTTSNSSLIFQTAASTTYSSSSQALFFSNFGSETLAVVSLGDLSYITQLASSSGATSYSALGSSTYYDTTSSTKVTSFTFPSYVTITVSTSGPAVASRTTVTANSTLTRIVGTTNSASSATTTTASFSSTVVGTQSTTSTQMSYSAFSFSITDTNRRYLFQRFLALNGEVLYIPTVTGTGTFKLADAGYTATWWQNEPVTGAYITSFSFSDFTSTIQSAATLVDYTYPSRYVTGTPSLSMDPNNTSVYKLIPTPLSAVDTMMSAGNNDYALFGLQAYNRADTSSSQGVSLGAGAFDYTFNGTSGATSYSAVTSISAPIAAERIHPRDTVSVDTSPPPFAEYLFNYSTSNTVTRV